MRIRQSLPGIIVLFFALLSSPWSLGNEPVDRGGKENAKGVNPSSDLNEVRFRIGQALASKDPNQQRAAVSSVLRQLDARIKSATKDHKQVIELLSLKAELAMRTDKEELARQAIREMHRIARSAGDDSEYDRWVASVAARWRAAHRFMETVLHLREAAERSTSSSTSAQFELLVGDVLTQRNYPDGPYDDAIEQYAAVAERHKDSLPDLADDARLRQAKLLYVNGQVDKAVALFETLGRTANEAVAETARHYKNIREIRNTKLPQAGDVSRDGK